MQFVKVHSSIWDNVKFQSLPNQEARLAFLRCLSAAKASDPEGQWPDRRYLEGQLRGDPWALPHLDAILAADLLVTDPDGRVRVPQWRFWQLWEGKRSAAILSTDAPDLLEDQQHKARRRQRLKYWVDRVGDGHASVDEAPEDIREDVRSRLNLTPNLTQTSREPHDHIDVSIDTSTYEGGTSREVPAPASVDDGKCPIHRRAWRNGRTGRYCPAKAGPGEAAGAKGYCALTPPDGTGRPSVTATRIRCYHCGAFRDPSEIKQMTVDDKKQPFCAGRCDLVDDGLPY